MTDDEIDAEYNAAKDEFERAGSAFARANARLHNASRAMCEAFDRRCREAEARAVAKDRAGFLGRGQG